MRKVIVFIVIMILCAAVPSISFTEDRDTVRLARTLYTLASGEDYETKLALGSVIMNRVDSPWYPDNLGDVLSQKHQFACGTRYDAESLRAAHALVSGKRTLDKDIIAFQAKDASAPRSDAVVCEYGNYNFYTTAQR